MVGGSAWGELERVFSFSPAAGPACPPRMQVPAPVLVLNLARGFVSAHRSA